MEFREFSHLQAPIKPKKEQNSSDSLGYLSWLEDKHNSEDSRQDLSASYGQVPSISKKSVEPRECSIEYKKSPTKQKNTASKQDQQKLEASKETHRKQTKKMLWDDKSSNAIASAMRCLRSKADDLKQKLNICQSQNKRFSRQKQLNEQKIKQLLAQISILKSQACKKQSSFLVSSSTYHENPQEEEFSNKINVGLQQKLRNIELQLSLKNNIIFELTTLLQQQKQCKKKLVEEDQLVYIQKINLLENQMQKLKRQDRSSINHESKCGCEKLTIKYQKLLERLSSESNRSSQYLKEIKESKRINSIYKDVFKELQLKINKLPETSRCQIKQILSRISQLMKSKEGNAINKSFQKSKIRQSRQMTLSRHNTHRRIDIKLAQQSRSISKTSRKQKSKSKDLSKQKSKKMNQTLSSKLKHSKSNPHTNMFSKQMNRALRQEISAIEFQISQIKSEYKTLAGRIHEGEPEEYESMRDRLNLISLDLQSKTSLLFQKRELLNDHL